MKTKTFAEIKAVIDNHTQMRHLSCIQSGVEMVLKLYEVIDADSYPEQAIVENDGRGFEPFKGAKSYGGKIVSFTETPYNPISEKAFADCERLLSEGVFPVLSFGWQGGFHSAVAFKDSTNETAFITKTALGKRHTTIWAKHEIWPKQTKTEILAVRFGSGPPNAIKNL